MVANKKKMPMVDNQVDGKKTEFPGPLKSWWDWRRKRFWAIILLLSYTLAGFYLVPWIAKREVIDQLQTQLDLPVKLAELRINPWALTVAAQGFAINEPDGSTIVGFDRLFINLQVSSLFRRALTFREVRLEKPFGQVTRHQDGTLNVDPIIVAGGGAAAEPAEAESADPLRLLIHALAISGGRIEARDESRATPFSASIGPIDLAVENLTTLPDRSGQQQVSVSTARGTRLEWTGTLELAPLISAGQVTGSGPYLPLLYQYFQDDLNFELTEGNVELGFDYEIAVHPDTGIEVKMTNAKTVLRDASLVMEGEAVGPTRFVSLPEIRLEDGSMAWPEQTLNIGVLAVVDAQVKLWLNEDGSLSTDRLLAPSSEQAAAADTDAEPEEAAPWDIHLGEIRIENLATKFIDHSLEDDAVVTVSGLDFSLKDITNQTGDTFPMTLAFAVGGGGDVKVNGALGVLPAPTVDADLAVAGLALGIAQPWLAEIVQIEIDAGTLNVDAKLDVDPDEAFGLTGSLTVHELDISDTLKDERLVGWESLDIDQLAWSTSANTLEVSEIKVDAPYARLRIAEDQSTNFEGLAVSDEMQVNGEPSADESSPDEDATESGTTSITVGQVSINGGSVDFSDLSLPLPFVVSISELNGEITTLSTVSEEPTKIELAGQVGEYGLSEINGQIKPLDPAGLTDVNMLFRNLAMPDLSPYTIKFAGREIAEGRMELDLQYLIEDSQLHGENSIVINKLELGDKVDHPDATNLPLGLAVALLTGPDGTINIDMPVTGDVDDPEFSVGGVVFAAFVNLITKIATSPFNLLGKLVGMESEDFDTIEFRPGEADLAPPEQEKLVKLAEALSLRPSLGLDLQGVTDPLADADALRTARVEAAIEEQLDAQSKDKGDAAMLTERRLQVVESQAREKLASLDFAAIKAEHQQPKDPGKPDGRQVLDEPAYAATLTQLLVDAAIVTDEDLTGLAKARANAVRDALTAGEQVDPGRVAIASSATAELNDTGWVPMLLELRSGSNSQPPEPAAQN